MQVLWSCFVLVGNCRLDIRGVKNSCKTLCGFTYTGDVNRYLEYILMIHRRYYMTVRGYEFYLRVFNSEWDIESNTRR